VRADEPTRPDPRAWEEWRTPPGVPDQEQLELLAADAAVRAAALLADGTTTTEDPLVDAVRLLASAGGAPHAPTAARLSGIPEAELRRLVLVHRHGGSPGVAATVAPTPCSTEEMATAVDEVRRRRAFTIEELSVDAGEITDAGAGVRLRRGPDGRWHPFTLARTQWWPAAGANPSAGIAYQAALRAKSLRRANG